MSPLESSNSNQRILQRAPTDLSSLPKTPCWFFSQGKCIYGAACKNLHDLNPADGEPRIPSEDSTPTPTLPPSKDAEPQNNTAIEVALRPKQNLKADATPFAPRLESSVDTIPKQAQPSTPCRFFAKGFCRRGQECNFLHKILRSDEPIQSREIERREELVPMKSIPTFSTVDEFSKEINGARVSYRSGAEISSVKLVSDFSGVQISGLEAGVKINFVCALLSDLGHPVQENTIFLKCLGDAGSAAEVRVEDPSFAKDVVRKWEKQKKEFSKDISIKQMTTSTNGTARNRLQLSTVTCTWYQPSRIAWLTYEDEINAENANDRLEESKILDRVPDCSVRPHYSHIRDNYYTLRVSNLHGQTTESDIQRLLIDELSPDNITLSEPTHDYSDSEAAEIVRGILQSQGELDSFQSHSVPGTNKAKATATFVDRDTAAEVVRTLHNTKIEALGNTKIFVNHVVSVKYNVPTAVTMALKEDLDKLARDIWQSGHIHLKVYPQTDPLKSFTALRVYGEILKDVASAKAQVEKLLGGSVVMKGQTPLWDSYFLNPDALTYLKEVDAARKVYIHRDVRKSQLLMYGGSVNVRNDVQQALVEKHEALHKQEHVIVLTPQLLKEAMSGGMRKLKSSFGEAVTLDVAPDQKTITITGSKEDFRHAQALLSESAPPNSTQQTEDCVVCWTEPTDPLYTTCGHTYCKECFAHQASSVSDGAIPLHCAEGTCKHVFCIDDLRAMLSFPAFESLLQASFDIHIRTHPKDFQYCPTPDCPQVYRLTKTGETFFCSICLTPVCTTCNVVSHDGMTCMEYKEMDSEDNKLLREYKREHDVRDCPNCKVGIEKNEGCNHMECQQCGAHICWFCMKVFEVSGECYKHMSRAHGDIYDD